MIFLVAHGLLAVAAAMALIRLVKGPSLADRVIAFDVILIILMSAIAIVAVERDTVLPLAVVAAIAIVAFTATAALTRSIERTPPP